MFGSMPTSTAAMAHIGPEKRDFAIIINSRGGAVSHARLIDAIRNMYTLIRGEAKDPTRPFQRPDKYGPWVAAPGTAHWVQETGR
jgi:hypothetical protein